MTGRTPACVACGRVAVTHERRRRPFFALLLERALIDAGLLPPIESPHELELEAER